MQSKRSHKSSLLCRRQSGEVYALLLILLLTSGCEWPGSQFEHCTNHENCRSGQYCHPDGFCSDVCQDGTCISECRDYECGTWEGINCGTCTGDRLYCTEEGQCVACIPDCTDKECGDDGCGGSCGDCPYDGTCQSDGTCYAPPGVAVESTTIADDTNDDGVVSPGETGFLRIALTNIGNAEMQSVQAILSSSTTGVTISNGSPLYLGNMDGSQTSCATTDSFHAGECGYPTLLPSFTVGSTVPVGTEIQFQLDITDRYGNQFSDSFIYSVAAIAQAFNITATQIDDDTNDDGVVSPGETGWVLISLQNTGTSRAIDIQAILSSSTNGVTISNGSPLYLGNMDGSQTSCATTDSFHAGECGYPTLLPSFTVGSTVPVGTEIQFQLDITDRYGNQFSDSFI